MNKVVWVSGSVKGNLGEVFNFNSLEMREHLSLIRKENRAKKLA